MYSPLAGEADLSGGAGAFTKLYGQFGFIPVTDIYEEDGIPHIGMAREVIQA